jgi:acetylornithine deacetylase/succinyl-diaminopimelate desuccinylase-like protein
MKKLLTLFLILSLFISLNAQTIVNRDPEIKKMVDEISRERIEQTVRKLVSFHTRHNLSEQNDPSKGIGAAWNWIKMEMEKSVPESGGRLTIAFEEYTAGGQGQRIRQETKLKNVVAILKGTDPSDDRRILISAHLDSRAALDNDNTSFAPGANDDGSGIAAILELVRIMSTRKFPATVVFMAVSGEEHGLYGAKHMAQKSKDESWNIIECSTTT